MPLDCSGGPLDDDFIKLAPELAEQKALRELFVIVCDNAAINSSKLVDVYTDALYLWIACQSRESAAKLLEHLADIGGALDRNISGLSSGSVLPGGAMGPLLLMDVCRLMNLAAVVAGIDTRIHAKHIHSVFRNYARHLKEASKHSIGIPGKIWTIPEALDEKGWEKELAWPRKLQQELQENTFDHRGARKDIQRMSKFGSKGKRLSSHTQQIHRELLLMLSKR